MVVKRSTLSPSRPGRLTRRKFVQAAGGAASAPLWMGGAAMAAGTTLEAYASATSVKPGAKLSFYVRDSAGSMTVARSVPMGIGRVGVSDATVMSGTVNVKNATVPSNASSAGCGWPVTTTVTIPSTWTSGLYYAVFGAGNQFCTVPFVVRPISPTAGVKVLVQVPVTTAQAYNNYGGKSLYDYNSSAGVPATQVSFNRPHTDPGNFAFDPWQASFVRWLEKSGIAADFCTSIDLHQDSTVLTGYQLFLTAGHDEYWSRAMRDRLDAMVAAGGNAAIFAGNTCWWQVRFEAAGGVANRTMVCYKSSAADPDPRAAYKTVNWIDLVPPYPENSTIGLGWNLGCSWTGTQPRPNTPWVAQRAEHWAFANTGIAANGLFGGAYVGYEADALSFMRGTDGRAYPTGTDATPSTLKVLAVADASTWNEQAQALGESGEKSGHATISIHSRGGAAGTVFNAGTIEWPLGLQPELDGQPATPLSQITRNVITQLSVRHVESADVRQWSTLQASGDGSRHYFTVGCEVPAGATLDGMVFRAYPAPVANSVPVYRYKYPQVNGDGLRYLYSRTANLGLGWIDDGIAFHAFATALPGTAAVFQHHIEQANGDGWRMFYSPNLSVPGWVFDDVAFFAPLA
jgi:hypothetical protein